MSDTVIRVENLWKQYRLGTINHGTLKADLASWWARMRGREDPNLSFDDPRLAKQDGEQPDRFWALKDINFEVKQGEVLGIIGKNGAGKSTLLKILSRVTTPTKGQIKVKGRIASLLEVGTGFHPELTGRENIFLNGAILGMSKAEIRKKLDEIIAFAEVEKFIDTPVKRYSSGMYVRLAFAVAAHLEPEILVVDEVLAVGDAEFQKKCLGKMGDVAKHGRTVLFVSHNMGAIRNLCSRAILLSQAGIAVNAEAEQVVEQYLSYGHDKNANEISWADDSAPTCEELSLRGIRILSSDGKVHGTYDAAKPINVEIRFVLKRPIKGMRIVMSLLSSQGEVAFASTNHSSLMDKELIPGEYNATCQINADLLNGGIHYVRVHFGLPGIKPLIQDQEYLSFAVECSGGHGSDFTEKWPGVLAPRLNWTLSQYT